jgi:hypothetical protein
MKVDKKDVFIAGYLVVVLIVAIRSRPETAQENLIDVVGMLPAGTDASALFPLQLGHEPTSTPTGQSTFVPAPTQYPAYPGPRSVQRHWTDEHDFTIPSATPDEQGFLKAPNFVYTKETTIEDSDFPTLLSTLQSALDERDSAVLSSSIEGEMHFISALIFESYSGATYLDSSAAKGLLDQFFLYENRSRVQGFWADDLDEETFCVNVNVYRLAGEVAHPTVPPDRMGMQPPDSIDGDTAVWEFCGSESRGWMWTEWAHDRFDFIVASYDYHTAMIYYQIVP